MSQNVTIIDRRKEALKEVREIIGANLIDFAESMVEVSMDNAQRSVDTGHLKSNIRMEPRVPTPGGDLAVVTDTGGKRTKEKGRKSGKPAGTLVKIGYGAYIELGTSKMAAQPYIAPAFKQVQAQFRKIKEGLRK